MLLIPAAQKNRCRNKQRWSAVVGMPDRKCIAARVDININIFLRVCSMRRYYSSAGITQFRFDGRWRFSHPLSSVPQAPVFWMFQDEFTTACCGKSRGLI